jgi:hypothetical protein
VHEPWDFLVSILRRSLDLAWALDTGKKFHHVVAAFRDTGMKAAMSRLA